MLHKDILITTVSIFAAYHFLKRYIPDNHILILLTHYIAHLLVVYFCM